MSMEDRKERIKGPRIPKNHHRRLKEKAKEGDLDSELKSLRWTLEDRHSFEDDSAYKQG